MATFLMFGEYSSEAVEEISADRTRRGTELIAKYGGKVKAMYALLGDKDLLLIVELPGIEEAVKASVALGKLTGISFSTAPALSVEEFDQLVGQV